MDTFDRLIKMVPPPKPPFDAGNEDSLLSVESMLRLKLPQDYKRLILTYGTGCWQEFWYLLNPNTPNQHLNFISQSQCLRPKAWSVLDSERLIRDNEKEAYPHPIFPEPGGILPWATTDNGGRFYWLTVGQPEHWPTIYYAGRDPDFREYNLSCLEILYGAVSGSLPIFEEEFGPDCQYARADSFFPKNF